LPRRITACFRDFVAAIAFYTALPIPATWQLPFQVVACWAPLIGIVIGGGLAVLDQGLSLLPLSPLVRSVGIVAVWIALTGGLHLDGAMDTADGLAVTDPKRRLEVMSDSATGAFGVMAAIVILLLKVAALTEIHTWRWLGLPLAAGWGRWGQQVAIARYPYLKPRGKGAFHKAALPSLKHTIPSLLLMLGLSVLPLGTTPSAPQLALGMALGGVSIACLTAHWFYRRLGGHTGDTYGAVVEWTEALFLLLLATL